MGNETNPFFRYISWFSDLPLLVFFSFLTQGTLEQYPEFCQGSHETHCTFKILSKYGIRGFSSYSWLMNDGSIIKLYVLFHRVSSGTCSAPLNLTGSNTERVLQITDPCRYDLYTRPNNENKTRVFVRIYVYFLGSIEAQNLVSKICLYFIETDNVYFLPVIF